MCKLITHCSETWATSMHHCKCVIDKQFGNVNSEISNTTYCCWNSFSIHPDVQCVLFWNNDDTIKVVAELLFILQHTYIRNYCEQLVHQQLTHTHTHTTVLLLFWDMSGTTRVSRYQKGKTRTVKTNLDLLQQEIVSSSGICWAICKSAPHPRQPRQHPTTQFFYGPDALPAAQPTASKHWRQLVHQQLCKISSSAVCYCKSTQLLSSLLIYY